MQRGERRSCGASLDGFSEAYSLAVISDVGQSWVAKHGPEGSLGGVRAVSASPALRSGHPYEGQGEGGIPAQLAGRAHVVAIRRGAALPQITIAIPMPVRSSARS